MLINMKKNLTNKNGLGSYAEVRGIIKGILKEAYKAECAILDCKLDEVRAYISTVMVNSHEMDHQADSLEELDAHMEDDEDISSLFIDIAFNNPECGLIHIVVGMTLSLITIDAYGSVEDEVGKVVRHLTSYFSRRT